MHHLKRCRGIEGVEDKQTKRFCQVVPLFNLIYRNASSRLHPNFRLTYPTMHLYNDEYYVGEHFAGVEIDRRTNVLVISLDTL